LHNPLISIIIPTLNSPTLHDTLQAIQKLSSLNCVLEILIVGKQEPIKFPEGLPCKYIPVLENPIPPKNRNLGADIATGEWLFFIDSDCLPSIQWIDCFLQAIKEEENLYSGSVDLPARMNYWSWCDHLLGFGDQVYGIFSGKYLKYTASINFAVKKSFFTEHGGFDESFTNAGEDLDFSFRLSQHGHKINYLPEAVVIHNHNRNDFHSAWKHLYQFSEGTAHLRMKNRNQWSVLQKIGYSAIKIKFLGEVVGFLRVLTRACIRPIARPRLLRYWRYLAGMVLLDFAHTQGLIHNFRTYLSAIANGR